MGANYSNSYHPPVPPMYSDYAPHHQQQQAQHQQTQHQQTQHQQAQQQYALHKQMSNFAPPPGLTAPRQTQVQPQSIAEWQEGLKVCFLRFFKDVVLLTTLLFLKLPVVDSQQQVIFYRVYDFSTFVLEDQLSGTFAQCQRAVLVRL